MTRILVTGATGFIGHRLVAALDEQGHEVRAMTRRPESYDGPGEPVAGDVHDADSLVEPLAGIEIAYYLVHSLDDADFERKDAEAARAFATAAAKQGVRQIIYLGGLGEEGSDMSAHLRSRREVEDLLGEHGRSRDRAARRDRRGPRRHLLGAHPPAGEEPPGDGGAQVGQHQDPADRRRRRDPLPRRRRGS